MHARFNRVVTVLSGKCPETAEHLEAVRDELLAFYRLPREMWRQIRCNKPQE
jgi:putative transposase